MIMIGELVFLIIGALFLVRALSPIKRLISELPEGTLKRRWRLLSNLTLFFLLFYFVFGYNLWLLRESITMLSMLGSLMLLLGGIASYVMGQLALQTANDVKDMAILQHESITDALTGLKNRRYFDQRMSEEVALSLRHKLPLSLMLLDVDHFKKINDTYGHQIGDEVLSSLAKLISGMVRDSDIVARYGGEEIAIITPRTSKEEAALLAERLRDLIEKTTVAMVGTTQEVVQVTVSLGICSLSAVITDKDALLEESDQALYLAKKYGRNRVVVSNW
ncbi:putative diguanylate cyclase [Sulfurospirillum halorespirans DSM 13726]|uniref:diguanylate cyclase n=2 Tax=Sulfurospirillum halorespirans TaxID=194424 RepID=A0A1D7TI05_9BACT|nr:putative diguanylate cyclase [Sulfurospirillum halorespirans DSM 13726]